MKNSRFCAVECLGVIPLDSRVVCSVVKRNERVHLIIRVKSLSIYVIPTSKKHTCTFLPAII